MSSGNILFFKNISTQSVITIIMGIIELVVFSLMSRLLSKEDFGYFAALTGVMTICMSITEAGLGSAIIQKKDANNDFVSTAFTLSWMFGGIGSVLLFVFAPCLSWIIADEHIVVPMRIMSLNVFLACIASVGKSMMIRNLEFRTYGTYEVMAYTCSSILGVALAFAGFGLYAIVSISVCNLVLLNLILYGRRVRLPRLKIVRNEVSGIMSFRGWLTLSVVVNNISQQMDRLLLPKWLSVSVLGAYNRPAGFVSTITGKINGIFDVVLFPMLSKIQDEPLKVQHVFNQSLKLLNSFSAVLFAIFFFNAELIIRIFFGEAWLELTSVLQIISVFIIFNIDNRLVDCFFRSLGFVDTGFWLRLIAVFVTFGSLYIGAEYGIKGVAISLLAANIFTVILKLTVLSHKVNVSLLQVARSFIVAEKPLIPLLGIGIPFLFLTSHSLFQQVVFACVMGCVILLLFLVFPQAVGSEYTKTVYPMIRKLIRK